MMPGFPPREREIIEGAASKAAQAGAGIEAFPQGEQCLSDRVIVLERRVDELSGALAQFASYVQGLDIYVRGAAPVNKVRPY